jgi:hypothetical protein
MLCLMTLDHSSPSLCYLPPHLYRSCLSILVWSLLIQIHTLSLVLGLFNNHEEHLMGACEDGM